MCGGRGGRRRCGRRSLARELDGSDGVCDGVPVGCAHEGAREGRVFLLVVPHRLRLNLRGAKQRHVTQE